MSKRKNRVFRFRSIRKSTRCMLGIILAMLLLNLVAWCSTTFSDWYANRIFPKISCIFSFVWGWVPFSVGEVMIALAILLTLVGLIAWIVCMVIRHGKRWNSTCFWGRIAGWLLTLILVTETCNCFILYHATPFSEAYFDVREYTGQELLTLYTDLLETANELSEQVARDADGNFVLQDDLYETAQAAMQTLGDTYPIFQGNYPQPKAIHASYLMSLMRLDGIYFPFSLEANYNDDMLDINLPDTVCHELTHLRGRLREDEAGFLAFLACIESDSIDFQYSGVIAALEYIQNALVTRDISGKENAMAQRSDGVLQDMFAFLPENYWEEKQETVPVLVATETVQAISDTAIDTTLKLNGIDDGKQSYSEFVTLLLAYWDSLGQLS